MSQEEYLRRQAQDQLRSNPSMEKLAPHQGDHWTQQVVNNEIENQRRRDEEARRQRG